MKAYASIKSNLEFKLTEALLVYRGGGNGGLRRNDSRSNVVCESNYTTAWHVAIPEDCMSRLWTAIRFPTPHHRLLAVFNVDIL